MDGSFVLHFIVKKFLNLFHAVFNHDLKLLLLKLKYLCLTAWEAIFVDFVFAVLGRNELRLVHLPA